MGIIVGAGTGRRIGGVEGTEGYRVELAWWMERSDQVDRVRQLQRAGSATKGCKGRRKGHHNS